MKFLKSLNYAVHSSVLVLALIACSATSAQLNARNTSDQIRLAQIQPIESLQWGSILGRVEAPAGWSVQPCEGDGPFLCVDEAGQPVGSIEIAVYPLETLPAVRQRLVESAHLEPAQARYLAVLNGWVQEHYQFFRENRQAEYGDRLTFQPDVPEVVQIGTLVGLRYGFSGVDNSQRVHEAQMGYVGLDQESMYVIHTAFDPASVSATFESYEQLTQFKPFLTQIVANLQVGQPLEQTEPVK